MSTTKEHYDRRHDAMETLLLLVLIGTISGTILAGVMKLVRVATGNQADILLYNMDYIPVLKQWADKRSTGLIFHYVTCISSTVILFYLLLPFKLEYAIWPYIFVFSLGGGILYFLSALTRTPPDHEDWISWFNWTACHSIFGFSVGVFVFWWV